MSRSSVILIIGLPWAAAVAHFHPQARLQSPGVGGMDVGHGPQFLGAALRQRGVADRAEALAGFHGLPLDHLEVDHGAIPFGDQLTLIAQVGFGDVDLPAQIVDTEAPLLLLGVDRQLHLAEGIDHLFALNRQVVELDLELGVAIGGGHHVFGQGRHHVLTGQMAKSEAFWA